MTDSLCAPTQEPCNNRAVTVVFAGGPHTLLAVARLLHAQRELVVVGALRPATVDDWAEAGYLTVLPGEELPTLDTGWFRDGADVVCGDYASSVWSEWLSRQQDVTTAVLHTQHAPTVGDVDTLQPGTVTLLGGGPGPSNSLTLGAWNALAQSDAVVTDRLVPVSALAAVHRDAELVDVAKIPHGRSTAQEAINQTLIDLAEQGRRVVRLKGGDPFVFGRGFEEAQACEQAGVPWALCSGVSSAIAVPAANGIPVTHRGLSQSVSIVSGHVPPGDPRSTTDWEAVARVGGTVVILMGVANAAAIAATLQAGGMSGDTPAAACRDRGNLERTVVHSSLGKVGEGAFGDVQAPAVLVFGDVVSAGSVLG